nr:ribonuclease H-like domain-containing protein [Tanacetum cinerariifolium]
MPKGYSVRTSGVIIKDWVSDDEDTLVDTQVDSQTTVKPSFKYIEFTKARNESVKSDKQVDKPKMVTQNSKADRKDWNGNLTQKPRLGLGFTKKTCFVCGSQKHLIKDCDFHENRMSKKSVLNDMGKGIGQREVRPIWNNTQRINHQNKFVPTVVLTRTLRYLSLVAPLKKAGDEAVHKELGDRMEKDATTASSLEAEQDIAYTYHCQLKVNAARLKFTTARVYAAEISPTIHTSCIKQVWTLAKVKKITDEVQIQALVDVKMLKVNATRLKLTIAKVYAVE